MRIMVYTGKGGVGKTSVAAATAVRAAELGYRTIVISTDAAHSLADSFDTRLAPEPVQLSTNLWAQELDVLHQIDVYWGTIQQWMRALAVWQGVDEILADEMAVLPGMEELASLLQIVYLCDTGKYDLIIVDSAPTGETLRLLSFPEVGRWWLEKIFPIQRRAAQVVRPVVRRLTDLPIPGDDVYASGKVLLDNLERMRVLLADRSVSSVRLVVNPEKMVIKEAQRTFAYLNLFGYNTDAVIVNRVVGSNGVLSDGDRAAVERALEAPGITEEARRSLRQAFSHWSSWAEMQRPYLELINASFSPVPILYCPFFREEVVGTDMLRQMAVETYGEQDPTKVMFEGAAQTVDRLNGNYVLSIPLPLVTKGDIDLTRTGDDLVVRIGNHKRNVVLPRLLANLPAREAKIEDGKLRITFVAEQGKAGQT